MGELPGHVEAGEGEGEEANGDQQEEDLEGKRVEVKGWKDAAYARHKVIEAVNRYQEKNSSSAGS